MTCTLLCSCFKHYIIQPESEKIFQLLKTVEDKKKINQEDWTEFFFVQITVCYKNNTSI